MALPRLTARLFVTRLRAACSSTLGHQLALATGAVVSMAAAVSSVRPVYMGREPVVRTLVASAVRDASVAVRDSVAERAPWAAATDVDSALRSTRFEIDRLAFVQDLLNTGRIDSARAQNVGTVAVREAYKRRLPPALVFGVLLTENADFRSHARSRAGAVGLMQIAPRVWIPELAKFFGRDLTRDETNLQYGVHILSKYLYRSANEVATADHALNKGLLRYNGCAGARSCQRYPARVRRMVEQYAATQCGAGGFEGCVARPLRRSLGQDAATEQVAAR